MNPLERPPLGGHSPAGPGSKSGQLALNLQQQKQHLFT